MLNLLFLTMSLALGVVGGIAVVVFSGLRLVSLAVPLSKLFIEELTKPKMLTWTLIGAGCFAFIVLVLFLLLGFVEDC